MIKLLEGKKSSFKQTKAANEKAEDEAWERQDEIVAAARMTEKTSLRHEDTSNPHR